MGLADNRRRRLMAPVTTPVSHAPFPFRSHRTVVSGTSHRRRVADRLRWWLGRVRSEIRYLPRHRDTGRWVQERTGSSFAVGTLTVNLSGAFLLGVLAGNGDVASMGVVAGVGFLGGFTTFSTWMVETVRSGLLPVRRRAIADVTVMLVGGLALAAFGYSVA